MLKKSIKKVTFRCGRNIGVDLAFQIDEKIIAKRHEQINAVITPANREIPEIG
jgi:hypothetical protein